MEPIFGSLLVFCTRSCDMCLGTVRMILVIQGPRLFAAVVGFIEATIFVLAIPKVITSLTDVSHILGYSGGFALGTYLGMYIEEKLSLGYSLARIGSRHSTGDVATKLWEHGLGASVIDPQDKVGPVKIIHSFIRRRDVKTLLSLVDSVDPKAFITIHDARSRLHGYLNPVKKR